MSDKPIPEDLYQQVGNHGYDAGCECDLVGGDPECKIQPPYESNRQYLERMIDRVMQAEARIRELEQERDSLRGAYEHHLQCAEARIRELEQEREAVRTEYALSDLDLTCKIAVLSDQVSDLQAQLQAVTQERDQWKDGATFLKQDQERLQDALRLVTMDKDAVISNLKYERHQLARLQARNVELEAVLEVASIAFKEHNGGVYDEARERYRKLLEPKP